MPQPTMSDLHVDRPLTDLSTRFTQSADQFIADKVFPAVNVAQKSDKYYTYDRSYWFRTDATLRGPGSESAGSGYEISTDNFNCDVYAIHKDVDDQSRANADSPITLDKDATQFVTEHLLQYKEQDFVSTYLTTGVWGTDVVGGTNFTQWSDYANSDPISDMRDGIIAMAKLTAKKPNTIVMGPEVWNVLQDHPDFLDRIKYTQKGIVGPDLLAGLIGVDKVLIPWSVKNTSAEGETASYSFNHGKSLTMLYVPGSPGLNTVSAGYQFRWTGLIGAGGAGIRVKRFRLERNASDRVEAEMAYDLKVVSSELGYHYSACVA